MGSRISVTGVVALLVLAGMGCTTAVDDLLPGGVIDDPNALVVASRLEFLDENDPLIEALDPPPKFEIMNQGGGFQSIVVVRSQNCGSLPEVRVAAVGGSLEITIDEDDGDKPCEPGELLYIELTLAAEFNRHSIVRR